MHPLAVFLKMSMTALIMFIGQVVTFQAQELLLILLIKTTPVEEINQFITIVVLWMIQLNTLKVQI